MTMGDVEEDGDDGLVVRARGLPWSCTEEDVKKFFNDPNGECISRLSFTFNREGRPSGEVYVEFNNDNSFSEALMKDHEKMGHRYIEVFQSKKAEMDHVLKVRGQPKIAAAGNDEEAVVRLRGLPFGCTKEEIANFFSGLEILPNGITMPLEGSGRASGEAFVQFADSQSADKALEKHMQNIAHRYIEVFRSSFEEYDSVVRRMAMGTGYAGGTRGSGASPRGRGGGPMSSWSSYPSGGGSGMMGGRPGPYDRPTASYGAGGGYGRPLPGNGASRGMGYGSGGGSWTGGYGGLGWNGGGSSWTGSAGSYGGSGGGYGGSPYGQNPWGTTGGGWQSAMGGTRGQGGGPIRPTGGRGRGGAVGGIGMGGLGGKPMSGGSGMMGGGATLYCVKMRGLPFNADENDVAEFFAPMELARVELLKEFRTNRPSGEAKVGFYSMKDAEQAMKKDKAHMGTRYIELFLDGPASGSATYTDFTSDHI